MFFWCTIPIKSPQKKYHNLYFVLQNEKHETTSASLAKRFPSRDMFSEQTARVRGYDPIQNGIHRNSQTWLHELPAISTFPVLVMTNYQSWTWTISHAATGPHQASARWENVVLQNHLSSHQMNSRPIVILDWLGLPEKRRFLLVKHEFETSKYRDEAIFETSSLH